MNGFNRMKVDSATEMSYATLLTTESMHFEIDMTKAGQKANLVHVFNPQSRSKY